MDACPLRAIIDVPSHRQAADVLISYVTLSMSEKLNSIRVCYVMFRRRKSTTANNCKQTFRWAMCCTIERGKENEKRMLRDCFCLNCMLDSLLFLGAKGRRDSLSHPMMISDALAFLNGRIV